MKRLLSAGPIQSTTGIQASDHALAILGPSRNSIFGDPAQVARKETQAALVAESQGHGAPETQPFPKDYVGFVYFSLYRHGSQGHGAPETQPFPKDYVGFVYVDQSCGYFTTLVLWMPRTSSGAEDRPEIIKTRNNHKT